MDGKGAAGVKFTVWSLAVVGRKGAGYSFMYSFMELNILLCIILCYVFVILCSWIILCD